MCLLPSLLLAALLQAAPPSATGAPDGKDEEKILKDAGLPTDTPSLLKFFRTRTPSQADRDRLAGLVRTLGSRSFAAREKASRELVAAGEFALPFLKAVLRGSELEVRRRAENCIQEIERLPHATLAGAAARLLAVRRPQESAEVLLAYLPFADWDALEDALLEALGAVGLKGEGAKAVPLAAVGSAAADKDPRRRAAAAYILGRAAAEHRKPLDRLLVDADAAVRYRAAVALIRCRDKRGVDGLLALLDKAPLALAWRAEELLGQLAGEQAPLAGATDDPASRRKWQTAWEGWWKANRDKFDLAKVNLGAALGLTVVCEIDGVGQFPGRVSEFDRGGNLRRVLEGLDSPSDFQRLPAGRMLVAEHWAQRVTERDRQGKILWEKKLSDKPVSCARLANGNTFIATYTQILEVNSAGKEVFSYRNNDGMVYSACKLRGGNVLFITSSGKVAELDAKGAQVRTFTPQAHAGGASYWAAVEPLRGGKYLISLSGAGKVVETDATGKILWECSVPTACWAARLPGGNTLVANVDGRCVVEVDRKGKEVWKRTTKGRPFVVRRY
jgi:putative pyrroloquinoline-quinone binding quinoprotein